jgi:uncharacterized OB-fold protein
MKYLDKSFTVGLGEKAYRDHFDATFRRPPKIIAKKCPACGMYNEATFTHCGGCGAKLKEKRCK